ncbi:zinc finger FYVE domain-containing protein 16 isoform X2 [Gouania willdenowi]|uniref:zinc finger FYVE domain-containing protein 16 isoform X2 n=1 Tax=Gouania willdenowi TaxID=441366 RepID=UPI001056D7B8|nr:zinc finger FYVE domain-containing protein 16 isoform X2 [Gouania willdenowi]
MDSFFKAAVCDLDKLLDDFELSTDELECKPVFLKPPAYNFSPEPQSPPSEASTSPYSLPDLSRLHYGCAPADRETAGQPLTGVDLLSSVDRRPSQSSAPPCPDRALKPVCDLVSDTSSAIMVLDTELPTEGQQELEAEALLVDFDGPVEQSDGRASQDGPHLAPGYSASLSLLDVILPAGVERSLEECRDAAEVQEDSSERCEMEEHPEELEDGVADSPVDLSLNDSSNVSCFPNAAITCGPQVEQHAVDVEEPEEKSDFVKESSFHPEESAESAPLLSERRPSPEGEQQQQVSAEPSPVETPEFGFEFLPESDQAELLVTDEELDAFLQAESEAGGPYRGCCSQEARLCEEEEDEGRASPESDRTMFDSVSAATSSPDQHNSYGGARPKQLLCQMAKTQPAGGEDKGEQLSVDPEVEDDFSPTPTEDPPIFSPTLTTQLEASEGHEEEESYSEGKMEESDEVGQGEESDGVGLGEEFDGGKQLGSKQPSWVPDAEAPNCMNCKQRFTFTKRRHHCRACGKVYCAVCCNRRCKLRYLQKEARVCVQCFDAIHKGCPREQKRVWFADGILPNGEVADTTKLSVTNRRNSQEFSGTTPDQPTPGSEGLEPAVSGPSSPDPSGATDVVRAPVSGPWDYSMLCGMGSLVKRVSSLLPDNEDELPPLLISTGEEDRGDVVQESPAPCQIHHLLEEGGPRPLTFIINANLLVNVKLVTYSNRQCWCFGSNGLQAVGQKEVVFLLECLPEEKTLPKDLFSLFLSIYQDAQKGKFVEQLDNVTFTSSFLGSKEHGGVLFFCPSFQPLDGLALPPPPFLFGLLILKMEVPWAKVFPLRLLLRLGLEYDVYPTALVSVRFRDSVYRETGHTIMNLLADLRNYQYSLPVVEGLRIHMEMGHSYIDVPKSSFNEMQKVVNTSNEHVVSIGAGFSSSADSHLVCFQNQDGTYQTQASSRPGKTRTVTGASFVVFNGALKASSGFIAKSSIVEDGLMVQIPPETMESLRSAFREQTDFHIACGKTDGGEIRETVSIRWVDTSSPVNTGKVSGVDGRPLDGVPSVRMQQDTEFESNGLSITCTEVFYQLKSCDRSLSSVLSSCSVFQKEVALATCSSLTPHLSILTSSGINSLWLRLSTQADMVEYQAGCGGRLLPQRYMNEMDGALIPVLHGGSAGVPQSAMDVEFSFYITHVI